MIPGANRIISPIPFLRRRPIPVAMAQKSGLGSALRRMMGSAPPAGAGHRPAAETVLMNETRLRIFRSLCNRPGSHVRALSREAGVAPPSVLWHLGKLVGSGAVLRGRLGNRAVYYPAGMVEPGDIELLAFIGDRARFPAVRRVLEGPGTAQGDLTAESGVNGHALDAMVSRGALVVVRDGRHRRYYPAPVLGQKRDTYERRARRFRQQLMALLEREGLSPEAERYDRTFLEVRVTLGTKVESLRLLCNPFALDKRD
jgi:DNA-binding transcriptional ArsR family regulator